VSDFNPLLRDRNRRLAELRTGLGEPLPRNAHAKVERLLARLELVLAQIAELERQRDAVLETDASDKASAMIQQLTSLRGIGVQSATVLVREAFVRRFANGKALGSYAGRLPRRSAAVGSTVAGYRKGRQSTGQNCDGRACVAMDTLPTRCSSGLLVP
jgi:transposase